MTGDRVPGHVPGLGPGTRRSDKIDRANETEEESRQMPVEPGKIRNVAVVGHRSTGKTSLVEAMLLQAGAINRLGTIEAGSTTGDWDDDEHNRQMSLAASLCHVEWQGRKINLIDTPGDPGFQGDMIAALRVVEGALVVVSAVMGVEVQTSRAWQRAEDYDLSRVVVVNMLDRERADFFRTLEALRDQLSPRCVAVHLPIGAEHELTGDVDLLHMKAYTSPEAEREAAPSEIPAEMESQVAEYREKLLDSVVETDEALMERYLDGQELSDEEVAHALKDAVTRGEIFPVACAVATKNLGTTALLDLLVEGVPSPAKKHIDLGVEGDGTAAFVFKTIADPFAGRINVLRVISGEVKSDSTLSNHRSHSKERVGQLLTLQGKDHTQQEAFGAGDIGAVAKLKDTTTGDLLLDTEREVETPELAFPEPVMSFAVTPKAKGDEEKVGTALRRLSEEDPTLVIRRDPQTGEQLLSCLSQIHVEVAVDRVKSRFGAEVELHQPRVPYLETIRKESRAQGRYKKQTGGRGELAGAPVQGLRVRLIDGSYHSVDSSEMAFKIAGSLAFKQAYEQADPVLLEPIMDVEATVPDESVGAVNGDLNSRRGRLQGMEPKGGMTTIKAEVPMSEILTYSQSLTSLTGGRGDYHMSFARYEEVPTHIAQKVIAEAKQDKEEAAV